MMKGSVRIPAPGSRGEKISPRSGGAGPPPASPADRRDCFAAPLLGAWNVVCNDAFERLPATFPARPTFPSRPRCNPRTKRLTAAGPCSSVRRPAPDSGGDAAPNTHNNWTECTTVVSAAAPAAGETSGTNPRSSSRSPARHSKGGSAPSTVAAESRAEPPTCSATMPAGVAAFAAGRTYKDTGNGFMTETTRTLEALASIRNSKRPSAASRGASMDDGSVPPLKRPSATTIVWSSASASSLLTALSPLAEAVAKYSKPFKTRSRQASEWPPSTPPSASAGPCASFFDGATASRRARGGGVASPAPSPTTSGRFNSRTLHKIVRTSASRRRADGCGCALPPTLTSRISSGTCCSAAKAVRLSRSNSLRDTA
mmetsp:Transcript_19704/g.54121  ORF Transcript_19704/g.54121 Transcript_19704/m.54121 type:complete len:371 (-) Transcript_19704:1544-2656(-)